MKYYESCTYKFVEKLNLILEFPVFIDAYSRVWRLGGDKFEEWINSDSLYEFTMAFKGLDLLVLALLDVP